MIVGRKSELRRLENMAGSSSAEFMVLYGRRRVGKTFLIRQFFTFMHGISVKPPLSWEDAFKQLTELVDVVTKALKRKEKIVLFFDELPWLATPRSGLLESLDYYWNNFWVNNPKIILIVCGSSASWLIKNVIYNKGGLHNRCTVEMQLQPFNLSEARDFLRSRNIELNSNHILELYMALGGVPYYLTYIKKGLTAAENIQYILCDNEAPLKEEFNKLFDSLFVAAPAYKELIQLIASKKEGISRKLLEKQAKLSRGGGRLSDRLKQLEQTHFIESYIPWKKERGEYYKVIDEFCLFYLYWLQGAKSMQRLNDFWLRQIQKPAYHVWAGYAFEAVCHKHIQKIVDALGLTSAESVSTWRITKSNKLEDIEGTQIDLLINRSDDAITLCEIKYTNQPFVITSSYLKVLKKKQDVFKTITKTKKQIFVAIVSANGLKPNTH